MPIENYYLQDFSCFRNLSEPQLEAIARISDAVCYLPGQVLFEQGKPGDRLFFLLKGNVEVLYNLGVEGQERVDIVSGEEVVGCSALVEPYVYTATERCLSEVEVLVIDAVALRELMGKDLSLGCNVQQYLIKTLMERVLNFRKEAIA